MKLVGLSGLAGSGKDTVANQLVQEHHFVKIALADPMKRFCMEVFGFTEEQLWGPSRERNKPDPRYPRISKRFPETWSCLTPRYALQRLGTEWGRDCYADLWVNYALNVKTQLLEPGTRYIPKYGVVYGDPEQGTYEGVVISDIRLPNEAEAIRALDGQIWRVDRAEAGLPGEAGLHPTEEGLEDRDFDRILVNDLTLEHLAREVEFAYSKL